MVPSYLSTLRGCFKGVMPHRQGAKKADARGRGDSPDSGRSPLAFVITNWPPKFGVFLSCMFSRRGARPVCSAVVVFSPGSGWSRLWKEAWKACPRAGSFC
jgi:hypothetical protein